MQDPDKAFKYSPVSGNPLTWKSKDMLLDEETGYEFYLSPKPAAGALIINEDGKVLLGTRMKEPNKGMIDILGGFAETNETLEECAIREIKEEVNLEIDPVKLAYLGSYVMKYPYQGVNVSVLVVYYVVNVSNEELTSLKVADDVEKVEFYSRDEIPFEKISADDGVQALKDYLKKI